MSEHADHMGLAGVCATVRERLEDLRGPDPGEDRELLVPILESFVGQLPIRLAELADALRRRDFLQLEHRAHSLKGSAANLGADALAATCAELEADARNAALAGAPALVAQVGHELRLACRAVAIVAAEFETGAAAGGPG